MLYLSYVWNAVKVELKRFMTVVTSRTVCFDLLRSRLKRDNDVHFLLQHLCHFWNRLEIKNGENVDITYTFRVVNCQLLHSIGVPAVCVSFCMLVFKISL